ncbi:MAG: BA14K family protein [Phyllobacterium sp.]
MKALLRIAFIGLAALAGMNAASAGQNGVQPPRLVQSGDPMVGTGKLVIGGVIGETRTSGAARNCYGSTLCRESGTYIGDQGVLHYDGGNTVTDRRRKPLIPPTLAPRHVEWCSTQYRSYRTQDNSFQPYDGPRRTCVSPY